MASSLFHFVLYHHRRRRRPLLLLLVVFLINKGVESAPTYVHNRCGTTGNFSVGSPYQSNLKSLLLSLSSNATSHFFYNTSYGEVNGLFLCRGDVVDPTICGACVSAAAEDVLRRCPVEFEAIIWYEECMLRYSNRSFFGTFDEYPNDYYLENSSQVADPQRFDQLVAVTVRAAAAEAEKSGSPGEKKFATKEANFTSFQTLYSLVECTPDISGDDCRRCLDTAIAELPKCCSGEDRVTYFYPSCYLRYDKSRFYDLIVNVTSQPPMISTPGPKKISTRTILAIVVPSVICFVLILILGYYYLFYVRKKKKNTSTAKQNDPTAIVTVESLEFDLATIEDATNKFSPDNKLGQGGFGEVYKGRLHDGQEIAVKRLILRKSGDGSTEFKNEVVLLAKLQHRYLVRLLGFCLAGEEKLLVYEFVPNKSLDYFLYDRRKGQLDWSTRQKIIGGIARGILYLHEDSRLRIIHRDLKPSNILLDADYEPKISDFGIARLFGADQTRADTSKISGTFGYMAPEYLLFGRFSPKSDVYSFGIIILEIISGKRNSTFYSHSEEEEDFLSYAWKHWKDGTALKLLDETIKLEDSVSEDEVARCVQIGLLCVQEDPDDRPKMATIALMLNTSSITLPTPRHPTNFGRTKTKLNESNQIFGQSSSQETPLFVSD